MLWQFEILVFFTFAVMPVQIQILISLLFSQGVSNTMHLMTTRYHIGMYVVTGCLQSLLPRLPRLNNNRSL